MSINPETLPENTAPSFEFQYVDIGSVGRGRLVEEPPTLAFADAPSRARRVLRPGDTVVSTVRTYLRAVLPIEKPGLVGSTGFACLRPRRGLDPRFLGWWAQSDGLIEEVVARSVGVSYPAINPSELGLIRFPLRPASEQRAIADYLDTETARIDALIAKKRQLLALLRIRWLRTLEDRTSSGEIVRAKFVTSLITSGPRGWGGYVGDVGAPFIRSGNLSEVGIEVSGEIARVTPPTGAEAARSQVHEGDVLVGITGANTSWVGLAKQEHEGGYVSQHVALLRPHGVHPAWLAFCLLSPAARLQLLGEQYGGTKQQLGLSELAELRVGVPPPGDQSQHLEALTRAYKRHRDVENRVERQIDLLREHRQALITAAVTGELEDPGVAA